MHDLNERGELSLVLELDEPRNVNRAESVELNIRAKTNVPSAWQAALKVNRQRVDGIDWHATEVKGAGGESLKGWHRHVYDPAVGDARRRVPIADPAPDRKIRTFIESVLKLMNVYIDAEAIHGQPELEFDP